MMLLRVFGATLSRSWILFRSFVSDCSLWSGNSSVIFERKRNCHSCVSWRTEGI